jgi:hypothetical protein
LLFHDGDETTSLGMPQVQPLNLRAAEKLVDT